jgi:hypothetical protein
MRTEVRNQIAMLGNAVAAEVTAEDDVRRVWLWLGPVEGGVQLRRVEQPRGIDPEEWSGRAEDDPQVVARETFPNLDSALFELTRRGIDTEAFDAVWKTPNPF